MQERREELWGLVTLQASQFVDKFAWAVPDERALRILAHFSPVIEIAAGAGVPPQTHHSALFASDTDALSQLLQFQVSTPWALSPSIQWGIVALRRC